ncbi:MAG: HPr family phosphocarrier protein [Hungatella sp.]|nr:HPr family phosphocarrier protein [Hungatella sp.]
MRVMESKTFVLRDLEGLHARNAAKVVMAVQGGGDVKVTVRCGGVEADGENILELMSLNARYGAELTVTALGERAREILEKVEKAVNGSMI